MLRWIDRKPKHAFKGIGTRTIISSFNYLHNRIYICFQHWPSSTLSQNIRAHYVHWYVASGNKIYFAKRTNIPSISCRCQLYEGGINRDRSVNTINHILVVLYKCCFKQYTINTNMINVEATLAPIRKPIGSSRSALETAWIGWIDRGITTFSQNIGV